MTKNMQNHTRNYSSLMNYCMNGFLKNTKMSLREDCRTNNSEGIYNLKSLGGAYYGR